jgi:hypothetical protein
MDEQIIKKIAKKLLLRIGAVNFSVRELDYAFEQLCEEYGISPLDVTTADQERIRETGLIYYVRLVDEIDADIDRGEKDNG